MPAFLLVIGALAFEWGAARGITDNTAAAAQIRPGNPAMASALYQISAQQNFAFTLLNRHDSSQAPGLAKISAGEAAVSAAQVAVARKDFAQAVAFLATITTPPPRNVESVQDAAYVGEAQVLMTTGNPQDALPLLAAISPANVEAQKVYPQALLAAALLCDKAQAYNEEADDLNKLINLFPDSKQATTARDLMATPQAVVGTLSDRAGNPIVARVRLSSHFTALGSGSYQTTGPFYNSKTDASGDFRFNSIPLGGPYVLEVFRDGGWTTLIDPSTGKPADPVQVQPLMPADLAFIVLP